MTKNQKKSPASNEDVSEQNRIASDEGSKGTATRGGRKGRNASEAPGPMSEYLLIGQYLSNIVEKAVAAYTRENGDTPQNRHRALDATYLSLEKESGRSRAVVRLYIRCYQRFDALAENQTLSLKEMVMRLGRGPAPI
ncbi:hypothetical protein [Paraburkholderia sp. 40]|uniref:hypothetical protein n=1 Tax=Paraburkholderia sp. 40 TaxID=2991059 RepID=UPI003D21D05D